MNANNNNAAAASTFEVYEYQPHIGWDIVGPGEVSREAAWALVNSRRDGGRLLNPISVQRAGRVVWEGGPSVDDVEHGAWLSRCPR